MVVENKSSGLGPQGLSGKDYCLEIDWTEKEACIKCNEGGKVLVCSDSCCPLAIHEGCMPCVPQFDNIGNFYCPYCSYKQVVIGTHKARKKALLAKQALSVFLNGGIVGGDLEKEEFNTDCRKDPSSSTIVRNRVSDENRSTINVNEIDDHHIQIEKFQQERFSPKCNSSILPCTVAEASTSNEQKDGASNKGKVVGNQLETMQVGGSVQVLYPRLVNGCHNQELVLEAKPLNMFSSKEETANAVNDLSTEWILENTGIEKDEESRRLQEDEMQEQKYETTLPSRGGDSLQHEHARANHALLANGNRVKKKAKLSDKLNVDKVHTEKEIVAKESKQLLMTTASPLRKSPRKLLLELNTNEVHEEKDIAANESRLLFETVTCCNGRRRKLWTTDEEEILREGVHKYSSMVNKNIPWRKILEFGRHVFDASRTPADLKDKWRNNLAKKA